MLLYEQILVFTVEHECVGFAAADRMPSGGDIPRLRGKKQLNLDFFRALDFMPAADVKRDSAFRESEINGTLLCKPDLIFERAFVEKLAYNLFFVKPGDLFRFKSSKSGVVVCKKVG